MQPFGKRPLYAKYARYFGDELTPTLAIPGAVIAGALTSHGVPWGSLTLRPRDLAVKGHLPRREVERVRGVFAAAPPEQARVLALHHNVLRGEISGRMGLARWRRAQRRIAACGAEVVLCGHDHQEDADVLGGRVVVSIASTLCRRNSGGRPATFHFVKSKASAGICNHYPWGSVGAALT